MTSATILRGLAAAACVFVAAPAAAAVHHYTVTQVETPDVDQPSHSFNAMNRRGRVVGQAPKGWGGPDAFATHAEGLRPVTLTDAYLATATDINNPGQVVGYTTDVGSHNHAFVINADRSGYRELPTLGGLSSVATSINDAGQIAGYSAVLDRGQDHAFVTAPGHIDPIDLGVLYGRYSRAYGINSAGDVVGQSDDRAFVVLHDKGRMEDLGSLGGTSSAQAINDNGLITGDSRTPEGELHVILTRAGRKHMIDLGNLGMQLASGMAINSRGDIVGWAIRPSDLNFVAILIRAGTREMIDLNTLAQWPGVIFNGAVDINDHGEILVYGDDQMGYILHPTTKAPR